MGLDQHFLYDIWNSHRRDLDLLRRKKENLIFKIVDELIQYSNWKEELVSRTRFLREALDKYFCSSRECQLVCEKKLRIGYKLYPWEKEDCMQNLHLIPESEFGILYASTQDGMIQWNLWVNPLSVIKNMNENIRDLIFEYLREIFGEIPTEWKMSEKLDHINIKFPNIRKKFVDMAMTMSYDTKKLNDRFAQLEKSYSSMWFNQHFFFAFTKDNEPLCYWNGRKYQPFEMMDIFIQSMSEIIPEIDFTYEFEDPMNEIYVVIDKKLYSLNRIKKRILNDTITFVKYFVRVKL